MKVENKNYLTLMYYALINIFSYEHFNAYFSALKHGFVCLTFKWNFHIKICLKSSVNSPLLCIVIIFFLFITILWLRSNFWNQQNSSFEIKTILIENTCLQIRKQNYFSSIISYIQISYKAVLKYIYIYIYIITWYFYDLK